MAKVIGAVIVSGAALVGIAIVGPHSEHVTSVFGTINVGVLKVMVHIYVLIFVLYNILLSNQIYCKNYIKTWRYVFK